MLLNSSAVRMSSLSELTRGNRIDPVRDRLPLRERGEMKGTSKRSDQGQATKTARSTSPTNVGRSNLTSFNSPHIKSIDLLPPTQR